MTFLTPMGIILGGLHGNECRLGAPRADGNWKSPTGFRGI